MVSPTSTPHCVAVATRAEALGVAARRRTVSLPARNRALLVQRETPIRGAAGRVMHTPADNETVNSGALVSRSCCRRWASPFPRTSKISSASPNRNSIGKRRKVCTRSVRIGARQVDLDCVAREGEIAAAWALPACFGEEGVGVGRGMSERSRCEGARGLSSNSPMRTTSAWPTGRSAPKRGVHVSTRSGRHSPSEYRPCDPTQTATRKRSSTRSRPCARPQACNLGGPKASNKTRCSLNLQLKPQQNA